MRIIQWASIAVLAACGLSACDNGANTGPGAAASAVAVPPSVGAGEILFAAGTVEPDVRTAGLQLDSGPASWVMSGVIEMTARSPGGLTSGFSFPLPAEFEQGASGQTVTIEIASRIAGGGTFAVAYSTNEVGNSGWQDMTATSEYTIQSVQYNVPALRNGSGDFLGIAPDPLATGQAVEIAWIKLSIN